MRISSGLALFGVSFIALATPALAQSASEGASETDIIVTARRKDESIQDVPLTVNAVSSESIQKLNLRDLKDVASVVPGLTLNAGNRATGQVISLRGLAIDNTTSGNNGTVQFYLNDSPMSGGVVLQSMFDIGQIEVLRGPQGTTRGVASPSGSITITTHRPDMEEWGGYASGQVNTLDGYKIEGAINAPIIKGVLAVRLAAMYDKNEGSRVVSLSRPGVDPFNKSTGFRATVRLTPTDNIDVMGTYTHFVRNFLIWDQVESANIADPTQAASPVLVTAKDRKAVESQGNDVHQAFDIFNWQAKWSFAGQRLNYVGQTYKQDLRGIEPTDKGDFFDSSYPGDATANPNNQTYALPYIGNLQNQGNINHSYSSTYNHEVRLSSEERIFGMFNYTVGLFMNRLSSPTDLLSLVSNNFSGSLVNGKPVPANFTGITARTTARRGRSIERAVFGNLTAYIGKSTEISGGVRYLNYQENFNGPNNSFKTTVWQASAKHRFSDDLMVYASAGSSFRVGSGTNALILTRSISNVATITDPVLLANIPITPESSKSYEIGFRSTFMDKKITLNVSAFMQDFSNYIYPVSPYYIIDNTGPSATTLVPGGINLAIANTAAPVPAKVKGIEAEFAFRPSERFSLSGTIAYADAKLGNGKIPCNPPGIAGTPTIAQIQAGGTANTQIFTCNVNGISASKSSPFSASLQSEYNHPISGNMQGFLRGLVSIYGHSKNDPINTIDDISSYALVNLYAGVRAEDGAWEITAYARNLFNTFRVTDRSRPLAGTPVKMGSASSTTFNSTYRVIDSTAPREFGITARYSFGSR